MTILNVNGIVKTYGKSEHAVHALRGLDLSIEEGSFVSIMGKSGSGKSTLLHIMSGILKPTAGTIDIEDLDLFALSDSKRTSFRKKRIGFVFQAFNLFPELNVRDNICLPLKIDKRPIDEAFLKYLTTQLGIESMMDRYPSTLSGGQQQRVAIARALIHKPAIVFADEPTGNLDEETSLEVLMLLQQLQRELNQTLILVTHEPDIAKYSNRIVTLRDGSIYSDVNQV